MNSTNLQLKITLSLAAFSVVAPIGAKPKTTKKPNVILIFSDQHKADVFGYQGHPDVKTPNLDAMAKAGVVFNRAYCQNAISAPSRMSMFTGLYPRTIGAMDNAPLTTNIVKNAVSLQAALQANGYDTYAFGKRHLDSGADKGWTIEKSHLAKESLSENYVSWIEAQGLADEFGEDWAAEFGKYPDGNSKAGTKFPTAKMGTRTTRLQENMTMEAYSTELTLDVIRNHKKSDTPFFCFTSFYRPHQPYNPLPKYLSMYDITKWGKGTLQNDGLEMPESMHQPADELPPMLSALRKSKSGIWCLGLAAEDEQLYRNYIGSYYALVTEIDARVGDIFAELEKTGMAENTIVIYSSDHGDFVGGHGMIEKAAMGHNVYEETLQVPMMFFWKGKFPAGYENNDLVGLIDLYPTIMELTGSKKPQTNYNLQGISLAKTVTAKKQINRNYMVSENYSQATVITKDYKLGIMLDPTAAAANRDYREFGNMLFERKSDKHEVKNRINSTALQPVIKKLTSYYAEFEKQISDEGKAEMVKKHDASTKKRN
ncbi:MAG: sulfatase-like hydrolase/transferase [Paludibacter sp.]|nr:sulfatase-like hydrolase/transferase [Paludibacter sp.]